MTRRPVAASVDELIAGATSRTPMASTDSKSGARFERVVIDGERYVLKHVDRHDDWIMRQTGDIGCVPIVVWESGVLDLVPDCIDHTTVGAARVGDGGAVLMRDVGAALVPSGDAPLALAQHLRFLDHLAALHAARLGMDRHRRPDPGREPVLVLRARGDRMRSRARLPATGPPHRGRRMGTARPRRTCVRGRARTAARRALPALRRAGRHAHHVPPRRLEARQRRQPSRRAHGARRLVGERGRAAARRARALPRAQLRPPPHRAHEGRHHRRVPRRARSGTASPPARGGIVSSRCASSGHMLLLGWEKALDETGAGARVVAGAHARRDRPRT